MFRPEFPIDKDTKILLNYSATDYPEYVMEALLVGYENYTSYTGAEHVTADGTVWPSSGETGVDNVFGNGYYGLSPLVYKYFGITASVDDSFIATTYHAGTPVGNWTSGVHPGTDPFSIKWFTTLPSAIFKLNDLDLSMNVGRGSG